MRHLPYLILLMLGALQAAVFGGPPVEPFEKPSDLSPNNRIDELVLASLEERGIQAANLCSDAVFIRRAYIDVIGTLPEGRRVSRFLRDRRPGKRAALIEELMGRPEFADYWSLKWCDLLRVKAEFPINLWPNGVQAYHRWIWESVRDNRPYDEFVREMLTRSGSNFRDPPVNFYRAVQGHDPSTIAEAVGLTFMGVRVADWPDQKRAGMAAFFSRIAYKPTAEWKEEIVCLDPAPAGPLEATFPDGRTVVIEPGDDPRVVFADWLISAENPWFARNIANRTWAWLMGRGIIHEPDDIRPDNPPSNPALLDYLASELIEADYDLRHLYRLILNSRTYQQSPIPQSDDPDAEALFAHYHVRRLDAEVLIDALSWLGASGEEYSSLIPEPFTFVPERQRTIALPDGSITSQFLEMFGRPARDTGLESERNNAVTAQQRLHLLNSTHVQQKVSRSQRLRAVQRLARGNAENWVRGLYLMILSREPLRAELQVAEDYLKKPGLGQRQAADDLAWALINSKEFLYRH